MDSQGGAPRREETVGMKERPWQPLPASESSPELWTAADFGHEIRTPWSPNGSGVVRRNVVEVKEISGVSYIGPGDGRTSRIWRRRRLAEQRAESASARVD
jgi:hypothetical protein